MRGVGVMSLAVFTMWVFSRFAPDDSASLKTVIIIYSVVYILLGILCWFFVSDNNNLRSANNEEKQSFQLSDILAVLRIITTYSKVKSPTRVIQILSIIGLLALTALLVTNSNPQSVAMGIGLILLLGFTCYASRGLYWACPGEARTPSYIMGTTVGICSVIGFLPDVFVYPIIGHWQDTLPAAEAYRNMWLMGMAALAMVIVFTFLLFQKIRTADSAPAIASSK